jgi:4-hydroxybenzoate polyprenyltransferase
MGMKKYLSLIKFSHTVFALPFALIGFVQGVVYLESSKPTFIERPETYALLLLQVIGCMVTARSAAMAFNRYLDRRYDALNPRTAIREIPAGVISPRNALLFTVISSLLFIAITYTINPVVFPLSFVAVAVVLGYSYTKRFTPLCHLVLGAGLALAPLGAFLAVTGSWQGTAVMAIPFSLIVFTWVSGFDIIYALQDEEFDRSQGLFSIPAWLGKAGGLRVSEVLHLVTAAGVVLIGLSIPSPLYWLAAAVFMGLLFYQHRLVKPNDLSKVNIAFGTTNGIASIVYATITIAAIILAR